MSNPLNDGVFPRLPMWRYCGGCVDSSTKIHQFLLLFAGSPPSTPEKMSNFVGLSLISRAVPFRWLAFRGSCSNLFVGGLCYDTNEPVLKNAFEKYGKIIEVKVICDHRSGKSKGYGFVRFTSENAANDALAAMNNQLLEGRNIRVEYARKR